MEEFKKLLRDCNTLAKTRNRTFTIVFISNYAHAEERVLEEFEKGGSFEFMCELDDLENELQKYIDSYSEKAREVLTQQAQP